MKYLTWIDCATDGLGGLLELGIIITDTRYEEVEACSWALPLVPHSTDVEDYLASWPDAVREIHSKNGLILDCHETQHTHVTVEREAVKLVSRFNADTWHGEGIEYDRPHVREHLPQLADAFKWHAFDVATLNIIAESRGKELPTGVRPKARRYRALDDLRTSIHKARHFMRRYMSPYNAAQR